jgi:hypothetical protein
MLNYFVCLNLFKGGVVGTRVAVSPVFIIIHIIVKYSNITAIKKLNKVETKTGCKKYVNILFPG